MRDFVLDRLTVRPEVAHVESRVVYAQGRRLALEPLEPVDGGPLRRCRGSDDG